MRKLNKKVQIYRTMITGGGPNPRLVSKQYLYSKAMYDKGGLWCHIRDLTRTEIVASDGVDVQASVEILMNYNPSIVENAVDLWVEFMDVRLNKTITYAISAPADEFDHVSRIIKLSADQRIDDNNYIGAEYGK